MSRHRRRRQPRRIAAAAASALCVPTALGLASQPVAHSATVLAVEGTFQAPRTTQKSFKNEFCETNTCRTVNFSPGLGDSWSGAWSLQAAVTFTPGDLILMGYSSGAGSIHDRLRVWDQFPALGPSPDRVKLIVLMGNPENKYGGQARHYFGTGIPDDNPYEVLNVTKQYDAVADRPDRFGLWSQINLSFFNHFAYRTIDINDPNNLVYQDEDGATYMLIKAEVLPMLQWMDWFTTDERMAELDAIFRPLVERDYDRPDYVEQGEGADWGNGTPPPSLRHDRLAERQGEKTADPADDVVEDDTAGSDSTTDTEQVLRTSNATVIEVAEDTDELEPADLDEQVTDLEKVTETDDEGDEGIGGVTEPTGTAAGAAEGAAGESAPRGEERRSERTSASE